MKYTNDYTLDIMIIELSDRPAKIHTKHLVVSEKKKVSKTTRTVFLLRAAASSTRLSCLSPEGGIVGSPELRTKG